MSEQPGKISALLVPADEHRPCSVIDVPLSAAGFSDTLGGCLLDDAFYDQVGGRGYCLYLDDQRDTKDLPENGRAVELAARLSWIDQVQRVRLRGDVLVTGTDARGDDTDVPVEILAAARDLLVEPAARSSEVPAAPGSLVRRRE